MQDPRDGSMIPLNEEQHDALKAVAKQAGIPVLLKVGEVVEVKGGRFRVESIGRKFVRLRGMPGVRVTDDPGRH